MALAVRCHPRAGRGGDENDDAEKNNPNEGGDEAAPDHEPIGHPVHPKPVKKAPMLRMERRPCSAFSAFLYVEVRILSLDGTAHHGEEHLKRRTVPATMPSLGEGLHRGFEIRPSFDIHVREKIGKRRA